MTHPIADAHPPPAPSGAFTPEQKEYLAGFMAGVSASGIFVGTNSSGQLTASPADAASRISPSRLRMSIADTVLMADYDSQPS